MRQVLTAALAAAVMTAAGPMAAEAQNWKPTKPITIIVPWPAGGATDQVTRLTAKELEPALGTTVVVVNQPGASGSIGKKSVADGPKDGYTWTAGAPKQLGTYKLLGLYDTDVKPSRPHVLSSAQESLCARGRNLGARGRCQACRRTALWSRG
jgi:ABC-type glycerol-3-phosphate transport system substrate-binding protein